MVSAIVMVLVETAFLSYAFQRGYSRMMGTKTLASYLLGSS